MSEPVEHAPAIGDARCAGPNARVRRVLREARAEAVVVLAADVALSGGSPSSTRRRLGHHRPPVVDVAAPRRPCPAAHRLPAGRAARRAEPGPIRNAGVALPGLLIASDAVAVGVLLAALASSSATSLSAGELLAHEAVVWLSNMITFRLLFWQLDERGPRLRAERGRRNPDFEFPQDTRPRACGAHD